MPPGIQRRVLRTSQIFAYSRIRCRPPCFAFGWLISGGGHPPGHVDWGKARRNGRCIRESMQQWLRRTRSAAKITWRSILALPWNCLSTRVVWARVFGGLTKPAAVLENAAWPLAVALIPKDANRLSVRGVVQRALGEAFLAAFPLAFVAANLRPAARRSLPTSRIASLCGCARRFTNSASFWLLVRRAIDLGGVRRRGRQREDLFRASRRGSHARGGDRDGWLDGHVAQAVYLLKFWTLHS